MDEVGSEPRTLGRRGRAAVVVVVLLLVAALAADRWQRDRELEALLDAVAVAEPVLRDSQQSLTSLAEYQSALLNVVDVPPAAKAAAYENLARDARRWLPRLAGPARTVEATAVLPWHRSVRDGRDAYAGRLQAWLESLERTAADPRSAVRTGADGAAREAAFQALVAAGADDERVGVLLGRREARTGAAG